MLKSLLLGAVMLVATPLASIAAPVYFTGTLTSADPGVTLGAPPITFATWFDVGTPNFLGFSNITQGVFKTPVSSPTFLSSVTGTAITGPGTFAFALTIPGGPGPFPNSRSLNFSFTNANISTANSVAQNFQAILMQSTGVQLTEVASGGGSAVTYNGTITATPEPGSLLAFSALAATFGGVSLRRRRKIAAATRS